MAICNFDIDNVENATKFGKIGACEAVVASLKEYGESFGHVAFYVRFVDAKVRKINPIAV